MPGLMHLCELCHRHTDDLVLCRGTDEYLCEPCTIFRAEQYLYNRNYADDPAEETQ